MKIIKIDERFKVRVTFKKAEVEKQGHFQHFIIQEGYHTVAHYQTKETIENIIECDCFTDAAKLETYIQTH